MYLYNLFLFVCISTIWLYSVATNLQYQPLAHKRVSKLPFVNLNRTNPTKSFNKPQRKYLHLVNNGQTCEGPLIRKDKVR